MRALDDDSANTLPADEALALSQGQAPQAVVEPHTPRRPGYWHDRT